MFSTRLRTSSIWHAISSGLSDRTIQVYKEINTDEYDIAILDHCNQTSTHVLLINEAELQNEYKRLDEWLGRPTDVYRIAMLVIAEDSRTSAKSLQELQLHNLSKGNFVPVFHIVGGAMVSSTIKALSAKYDPQNSPETIKPKVENVMSHCTSFAPHKLLSSEEVQILKHICGSIEGLEKATRSPEGQELLYRHFSVETVGSLIKFWEDEWMI